MSPVSTEMIRSAIRYSGNDGMLGVAVVVVADVVVVDDVVVVVEVVGAAVVAVVVVRAGSLDDVQEAMTSAIATSK